MTWDFFLKRGTIKSKLLEKWLHKVIVVGAAVVNGKVEDELPNSQFGAWGSPPLAA